MLEVRVQVNIKYNTQSVHQFCDLETLQEQSESNHFDFEDYIGVCLGLLDGLCLHVWYPEIWCKNFILKGEYNKLVKPQDNKCFNIFVQKTILIASVAIFGLYTRLSSVIWLYQLTIMSMTMISVIWILFQGETRIMI